jgi:hypothetical protein
MNVRSLALLGARRHAMTVDVQRDAASQGPWMGRNIREAGLFLDLAKGRIEQVARPFVMPTWCQPLVQKTAGSPASCRRSNSDPPASCGK